MDIDDLLDSVQAAASGYPAERRALAVRAAVEAAVRRRLPGSQVSLCASGPDAPAEPSVWGLRAQEVVQVPVPVARGQRSVQLVIRPRREGGVGPADLKFLGRVAALYALATGPDARSAGPTGADDGHVHDGAAPLIGHSPAIQALRERIDRVARTDFTVLIEGESGSGKELVARHVHELSRRRRGPFIAVNCAAIVESLLEAELFGIEDHTATGVRGRRGKFEQASGGSLFLDEVADLSAAAQAKLLRAIQDLTVERVGGHRTQRLDLRIIVATNKRLRTLSDAGHFREDLYYRLSGVELLVPPLRTRREDVPELARYFLHRHRELRPLHLSAAAADALSAYDWPGNVRELERLVESALTLATGETLDVGDLPPEFRAPYADVLQESVAQHESLRAWSRRYVSLVFQRCGENKREACKILGISYHTLQSHLRTGPAYTRVQDAGCSLSDGIVSGAALVHERGVYPEGTRAGVCSTAE
jgi:DNA-binding NtrC family response regulator